LEPLRAARQLWMENLDRARLAARLMLCQVDAAPTAGRNARPEHILAEERPRNELRCRVGLERDIALGSRLHDDRRGIGPAFRIVYDDALGIAVAGALNPSLFCGRFHRPLVADATRATAVASTVHNACGEHAIASTAPNRSVSPAPTSVRPAGK